MYHQHTITIILFILFIDLFHWTSETEDCFANNKDFDEGFCLCDDIYYKVSCDIQNVSSDHIFWDKFRNITGFPNTIIISVIRTEVSYFPSNLFRNLPITVREVSLEDWSFESIPKIPMALQTTVVSKNSTLVQVSLLYTITIIYDECLTTISPFAFSSLYLLERLILSSNSLSNLAVHSFYNLTKLRDLSLDNNKIYSLPDEIFKSLEQLYILNLAHNEITSIRRETFIGLNSLQDLDLNRNKLLIIKNDTFHEMKKLRNLDLTYNSIYTIEQAAFRGLVSLRDLDLSYNQLRHLPNDAFKYAANLFLVNLKNNHFTRFDFDLINQLPKFAYLRDNPWVCDCSLLIQIENIIRWNRYMECEYYVNDNEKGKPIGPVKISLEKLETEIKQSFREKEKCLETLETIAIKLHKTATNNEYSAISKSIKLSSNQLMSFMSFIFIMLLLTGLDN